MLTCIAMLLEHMFSIGAPLLQSLQKLSMDNRTRHLDHGSELIRDLVVHLMNTELFWLNVLNDVGLL